MNMKFLKFIFISIIITASCRLSFSQETPTHIKFDEIEIAEKKRGNYSYSSVAGYMFEQSNGNYLYVHTGDGTGAALFLFTSEGKLSKSLPNFLTSKANHKFCRAFEMDDKIVVVTSRQGVNDDFSTMHFWNVYGCEESVMLGEVKLPKTNMATSCEIVVSADANFILIVKPRIEGIVVLDSNFKTILDTELVPKEIKFLPSLSTIEGFAIDNDGNVAVAMCIKEPAKSLKGPIPSYVLAAFNAKDNAFRIWDLGQMFKLQIFDVDATNIAAAGDGKFVVAYRGWGNVHFGLFDLNEMAELSNIEAANATVRPHADSEPFFKMIDARLTGANQITVIFSSVSSRMAYSYGTRAFATIDYVKGEVLSSKPLLTPAYYRYVPIFDRLTNIEPPYVAGIGYATDDLLDKMKNNTHLPPGPIKTNTKVSNQIKTGADPYLVVYDLSKGEYEFNKLFNLPEVEYEAKDFLFTNTGYPVMVVQEPKKLSLYLNK